MENGMTEVEQLIVQIRDAFDGVVLGDGISFNMTEYYDSGGCGEEYRIAAAHDERVDWRAIPGSTLEQFTVTFSFTDLEGFRFYIPAYMTWTALNFRRSDSIISDFTIYAIDPHHYLFEETPMNEYFTKAQMDVLIAFLQFCTENEDWLDVRQAEGNLKRLSRMTE